MIYNLEIVLKFGKYKGDTIEEVIENDPDYLAWAIDTLEWFELDEKSLQQLNESLYPDDDDTDDHAWHEAYNT